MKEIKTLKQMSLFDMFNIDEHEDFLQNSLEGNCLNILDINIQKYSIYNLSLYEEDVIKKGLKETWEEINYYVLNHNITNEFLDLNNLAELYEIGLALQDKQAKKDSGQYYTPDDVASVIAHWFDKQKGSNVCDVACIA